MWQMILNGTLVLNPIGLVIAAIVALIAVVILVIKNWDNIVAATKAAWSAIKDAISVAIDAIAGFFSDLWGTITGLKDKVLGFFTSAVSWLVSAGKNIISGLLDGIKDGWNTVTDWVGGMLDRILGFYANAGRWLYDIGKKIIQGLWDGLKDMWSNVTGWIGGLGDKIADLKGPPAHDARLLVGAGKLIMGGLESGLRSGWTGVAGYLGSRNLAISGGTLAAGRGGIGGLGAPTTININVTTTGLGADAPELQRAVVNALRGYSSRNGPLDIPVRAVT
jgi:phage-related protein